MDNQELKQISRGLEARLKGGSRTIAQGGGGAQSDARNHAFSLAEL